MCTIIEWLSGMEYNNPQDDSFDGSGFSGLGGLCFLFGLGVVNMLNTVSTNVFQHTFDYVFQRDERERERERYDYDGMEGYIEEMEREADIAEREDTEWSAEGTLRLAEALYTSYRPMDWRF